MRCTPIVWQFWPLSKIHEFIWPQSRRTWKNSYIILNWPRIIMIVALKEMDKNWQRFGQTGGKWCETCSPRQSTSHLGWIEMNTTHLSLTFGPLKLDRHMTWRFLSKHFEKCIEDNVSGYQTRDPGHQTKDFFSCSYHRPQDLINKSSSDY